MMGVKVEHLHSADPGLGDGSLGSSTYCQVQDTSSAIHCDMEKEGSQYLCRVCQSVESDRRGDVALGFLNILPPLQDSKTNDNSDSIDKTTSGIVETDATSNKNRLQHEVAEFISPDGEVYVCGKDVEAGSCYQQDSLIELGCSCKNELALAHYACALKWFISHGSTVCEICGSEVKNIRPADVKRVMVCLKDYEALRERTAAGVVDSSHIETNSVVDPDALAAVRRQRLSEIALWFNPHHSFTAISQGTVDQPSNVASENSSSTENPTTKWAVEGTGILVATGLLTVILAWFIAPHVGKRTAKNGLHILLGGLCALTVVIFLRLFVLTRIKYGPARYWAILFVFWFLVFGIWASRTHDARST